MKRVKIEKVHAIEVLDSRGNPTIKATVCLSDGSSGSAIVPSGASTGQYEACELRDREASRYGGKGVRDAVYHVKKMIAPALIGHNAYAQGEIDRTMRVLDGTEDKSRLGANAILGVSLAAARAAASSLGIPLYRYLGGATAKRLPVPMMNVLNGGAHAGNRLDVQEFMILPLGADSFAEGLRWGSEIYHTLKSLLREKNLSVGVGDEGGYAPDLDSTEQAIELLVHAIERAGYDTSRVRIALDAAASEWREEGGYFWNKTGKRWTPSELIAYYEKLARDYPIVSIEDGVGDNDESAWANLTDRLGDRMMLVGDDLFVTSPLRFRDGVDKRIANSILIKPNQIGTLSETMDVVSMAKSAGYRFILSHRSGDTEDAFLSDLAVALNAPYIKTGAPCRAERTAKYNRLLEIEEELDGTSFYG